MCLSGGIVLLRLATSPKADHQRLHQPGPLRLLWQEWSCREDCKEKSPCLFCKGAHYTYDCKDSRPQFVLASPVKPSSSDFPAVQQPSFRPQQRQYDRSFSAVVAGPSVDHKSVVDQISATGPTSPMVITRLFVPHLLLPLSLSSKLKARSSSRLHWRLDFSPPRSFSLKPHLLPLYLRPCFPTNAKMIRPKPTFIAWNCHNLSAPH